MERPGMRWGKLFDDLEGQLEQELEAEDVDLRAEEERLRLGRLSIRDRLLALQLAAVDPRARTDERIEAASVTLVLGTHQLIVRPVSIGKDWLSGDIVDQSVRRSQCIVPLDAITGMVLDREQVRSSLEPLPEDDGPRLSARLGLAFVLRDLCRRRRAVELELASGAIRGTIDRVGRDHLDLAVHAADHPRRDSAVTQFRVVPFGQLVFLRLG